MFEILDELKNEWDLINNIVDEIGTPLDDEQTDAVADLIDSKKRIAKEQITGVKSPIGWEWDKTRKCWLKLERWF